MKDPEKTLIVYGATYLSGSSEETERPIITLFSEKWIPKVNFYMPSEEPVTRFPSAL